MSNNYTGNPIVLDSFGSAISLKTQMSWDSSTKVRINSIEWQTPASANDTAVVTDGASGRDLFNEVCTTAKQSIIKYYYGAAVLDIYIASGGVASGKIVITVM